VAHVGCEIAERLRGGGFLQATADPERAAGRLRLGQGALDGLAVGCVGRDAALALDERAVELLLGQ